MTRKDYVLLTVALRNQWADEKTRYQDSLVRREAALNAFCRAVSAISDALKIENPNFDSELFENNILK